MNKPMNQFEELVHRASQEDLPQVDVRLRVLASISKETDAYVPDRIAFRFLIGSVSLAFVAILIVNLLASQEPPMEMISPFVSSLP